MTETTYKPLRRSRTDRMLGGVCAGFARYLGIDPVAARVLYLLLTFATGGALLIAYAIFWIVMPEEPAAAPAWPTNPVPPPPEPYPPPTRDLQARLEVACFRSAPNGCRHARESRYCIGHGTVRTHGSGPGGNGVRRVTRVRFSANPSVAARRSRKSGSAIMSHRWTASRSYQRSSRAR